MRVLAAFRGPRDVADAREFVAATLLRDSGGHVVWFELEA